MRFLRISRFEIENLENATDFSGYIKLLKMGKGLTKFNLSGMSETFEKLYSAYFTFVNRPTVFDDAERLNEVDQLHIEFWERMKQAEDYAKESYISLSSDRKR